MKSGEGVLASRLSELLASMKDWERRPLLKVGSILVEIVKLPRRESKRRFEPERLAVQIRREDSFRGLMVTGLAELEDLLEAVKSRRLYEVLEALDEIAREKRVVEYGI